MSQADKIAVVISTYNKPQDLTLTLEGYRHQDDHHFCIFIADDGSNDETCQLIKSIEPDFPVPIKHIWHEDRGFRLAEIRNRALMSVRECYVLITDGDCIPPRKLIATHRRLAKPGCFLAGSRLLLSQRVSDGLRQAKIQPSALQRVSGLLGLKARRDINRFWPAILRPFSGPATTSLSGLRGCHLSFWHKDLQAVNGFDQSFQGWGREDSDLVARLYHFGIQRRNLIGVPLLHLWHPEHSRQHLDNNDDLLQDCLEEQRIQARYGLSELKEAQR